LLINSSIAPWASRVNCQIIFFQIVISLTWRYVAILRSINKGSIHSIPPVNFPFPSSLKLLWKLSLITNHISFIAGRRNFLRSLVKTLQCIFFNYCHRELHGKTYSPVNFSSDENIQTIFRTKLDDFLNYRIDYNSTRPSK
jgi:hypothetical protein